MSDAKLGALKLLRRLRDASDREYRYMPHLLDWLRPDGKTQVEWEAREDVRFAEGALEKAKFYRAETASMEWAALDRAIATLEASDV